MFPNINLLEIAAVAALLVVLKVECSKESNGLLRIGLSNLQQQQQQRHRDLGWFWGKQHHKKCRILDVTNSYEEIGGKIVSEEFNGCIPINDNHIESDDILKIDLPVEFLEYNDVIAAGKLVVSLSDFKLIDEEIVLSTNSTVDIISTNGSSSKRKVRATDRGSTNPTTGTRTIAIIRISTNNTTPSVLASDLSDMLDDDKINFRTQYNKCSLNQLDWTMSKSGVVDVFVNQTVSNFPNGVSLVRAAQDVYLQKTGESISSLADKVLMCLPPGTGKWIATSGVGHWRAQFNDGWCLSLTAVMHEIGHALGLTHANEDGRAYGDSTGYMSVGDRSATSPLKCFNGAKNHQLGWFGGENTVKLNDGFSDGQYVRLATFVDSDKAIPGEPILINLADQYFLQYNRAKSFNVGTGEKKDMVTVTAPGDGGSEGLIGLSPGESYIIENFNNAKGRNLVIEICHSITSPLGADIMEISFTYDTGGCEAYQKQNNWANALISVVDSTADGDIDNDQTDISSDHDENSRQKLWSVMSNMLSYDDSDTDDGDSVDAAAVHQSPVLSFLKSLSRNNGSSSHSVSLALTRNADVPDTARAYNVNNNSTNSSIGNTAHTGNISNTNSTYSTASINDDGVVDRDDGNRNGINNVRLDLDNIGDDNNISDVDDNIHNQSSVALIGV